MRYEPWTEITASGLGFFLGGLFLVLFAARAFLGLLRVRLRHPVDGLAAYWVSGAAVVAGSVFLAGKTGLLFLPGILLIQAVALLVLLFAGRQRPTDVLRHLRDDLFSAGKTVAGLLRRPPRGRIPRLAWLLGLLLAVVLVELLVVGILTPDLNHDTNRYRLPRMGLWLQNNHIGHSNVPVVWMNAQGRIYEFLGIGLVSFFPSGFPLMHLISWVAGSALVASTYGLARRLRLPRLLRWAGIFVLLGQANVLVQFTTTQTDLTSAAFAAAGMLFVWDALKTVRTSSFILAGLAFGLAVGTKQTVLAWGPGFAVLALLWGWQFCTPWKKILRPATLAFFVGLPFCLPLFAENHRWYGDWLVPKSALQKFPSLKPEEKVRPLFYPAVVLWHLSWPAVQSPLLAPATEWMHGRAFEAMKASTLVGKGNGVPACAENLKEWMRDRFHEDIVPPSWPVYFFALGGGAPSCRAAGGSPPVARGASGNAGGGGGGVLGLRVELWLGNLFVALLADPGADVNARRRFPSSVGRGWKKTGQEPDGVGCALALAASARSFSGTLASWQQRPLDPAASGKSRQPRNDFRNAAGQCNPGSPTAAPPCQYQGRSAWVVSVSPAGAASHHIQPTALALERPPTVAPVFGRIRCGHGLDQLESSGSRRTPRRADSYSGLQRVMVGAPAEAG
jgi:hypothetical protein